MSKKLSSKAPTEAFLKQGDEQGIRLQSVPGCAPLAAPVVNATSTLREKYEQRLARERALVPIRIKCQFTDWGWDQAARTASAMAVAQTGSKKHPAYVEMFPDGTGPLVTPAGASQVKVAKDFLIHLEACTTPEARTILEEQLPKLRQASDALADAIGERNAGEIALFVARAEEQAARRDYNRTIDKTIAEVRALYPEDRGMQNLVFPSLGSSRQDADDTLEDLDATDENDEPSEQNPG